MAKLPKNLEEIRDELVLYLFEREHSAEDIGKIINLSTSAVYGIIKEHKEKQLIRN